MVFALILLVAGGVIGLCGYIRHHRMEVRPFMPDPAISVPASLRSHTAITPSTQRATTPQRQSQPSARQPWAKTIARGADELDRLIAIGDWDGARDALQRIAYGMTDAKPDEKAAFTATMCKFAVRDPLVRHVVEIVLPLIEQAPGLLQSKLYSHIPDIAPDLVRYALYYAAELTWIQRVKKGNTYALYTPRQSIPISPMKKGKA